MSDWTTDGNLILTEYSGTTTTLGYLDVSTNAFFPARFAILWIGCPTLSQRSILCLHHLRLQHPFRDIYIGNRCDGNSKRNHSNSCHRTRRVGVLNALWSPDGSRSLTERKSNTGLSLIDDYFDLSVIGFDGGTSEGQIARPENSYFFILSAWGTAGAITRGHCLQLSRCLLQLIRIYGASPIQRQRLRFGRRPPRDWLMCRMD